MLLLLNRITNVHFASNGKVVVQWWYYLNILEFAEYGKSHD